MVSKCTVDTCWLCLLRPRLKLDADCAFFLSFVDRSIACQVVSSVPSKFLAKSHDRLAYKLSFKSDCTINIFANSLVIIDNITSPYPFENTHYMLN